MNPHKLLLIAAAGLVAPALSAAQPSSVQVYGTLDALVYRKELAGEVPVKRLDSGGTATSFWGIRGTEDLGGGTSVQFDLSSFFRLDAGVNGRSDTDPYYSRSSWVGLQGGWGGLRLGRQTTLGFVNLTRYSAWGASSAFGPSFLHTYLASATQPMMTGSGAADSAWNNTLSYTAPAFGGLTAAAHVAAGENTPAGRRLGISLGWARGPFSAGLAVEKIERMSLNFSKPPATVTMTDSDVVSLGASYDFTVVKLFAQAIKTELGNATVGIDINTYSLGAVAPLGAGRVIGSYAATTKKQTAQTDQKRQTLTAGYEYDLSKRTNLYALAMQDRVTRLSDGTGYAFGVRHRF